jgi:hypothetical protein
MTPKARLPLAIGLSAALIGSALAQPVAEGGRKFTTSLSGAAELAGGAATADSDGSGTATIFVNHGQRRVCWEITTHNLDTTTGAHIHVGAANATGSIVVHLAATANATNSGCTTTPLSRERLKDIIQHPQNYYVNVHTTVYPGGAIRGQLAK